MSTEEEAFAFSEEPNTAVFTCAHVLTDGHPVLHVSHDADGDWQFLCREEEPHETADARIVGLCEIVKLDPTLNQLAEMCTAHEATRDSVTSPWCIEDHTVDGVRATILEHGVWIGAIEANDEGPAFAYTIGLHANYTHPELIMFGLPIASMHSILNHCADQVRAGARFSTAGDTQGILDAFAVRFRAVVSEESHAEYLGIGCRFYESRTFPVLQCVWPDKSGAFPGDPGAAEFLAKVQPLIP